MTAARGAAAPWAPKRSNVLLAGLALLGALSFVGADAHADPRVPAKLPVLKLPPRPRAEPPMRIVRVTSSDPACQPACPEWISVEGRIAPGAGATFARIVADLDGRRLPVLISSPGGSLPDAIAMGKLIRDKRLAVAVARTLIVNCATRAPACPGAKGRSLAGGARCASACVLVLAGGVERLVGPTPLVGVHQITLAMKETEGAVHLTRIMKVHEPIDADEAVEAYLKEMGIGDPVMALLRKTPPSSVRWLSLDELRSSRLATLALDAEAPVATAGANGLSGHAFDGAPARSAEFSAHGEAPGPVGVLQATLAYARGGGVVQIALADARGAPSGLMLTVGEDSLPFAEGFATIARDRFCAAARGGGLVAAVGDGGGSSKATFDLARLDGAAALIDEACP